jgi:polysaccharide export outer membrane protein
MTVTKINTTLIFISLVITLLLSSCASKKKIIYFQGAMDNVAAKNYTPTLVTDDLLSITVLGLDLDAVKPFNLNKALSFTTTAAGGYGQGMPTPEGYLIGTEGNINFPVLGKVKLAGLTRTAATDTLQELLSAYLVDPIVNIRILNFKVTVLGDVKKPGTFNIPNERISLPEAIGIAGDLNITGQRQDVMVIRDVDGKKTEYRIDLTSKELFSSPVFYLNQNDIVYVVPNRAKRGGSAVNPANAGIFISLASVLIALMTLITR